MLRTTEADPPEVRVTLEALRVAAIGEVKLPKTEGKEVRLTVPLNPLMLVS